MENNSSFDDGALIELVQQHEYLYDKSHKDFKNKVAKQDAWQSIAAVSNNKADYVEQRWEILKTRYNLEKRKIKNPASGSGPDATNTKWPFYEAMEFLDRFVQIKRSHEDVSVVEKNLTSTSKSFSSTETESSDSSDNGNNTNTEDLVINDSISHLKDEEDEDADYYFGLSLALSLKSIKSAKKRCLVMAKIMRILANSEDDEYF